MRKLGYQLLTIVILKWLSAACACAQEPVPTPRAADRVSSESGEIQPWYPAPPAVPFPTGPEPVPTLEHDRLLEDPIAPPGILANVELDLIGPHLKNKLQDLVTLSNGETALIRPQGSDTLDWTVAPRFELGYRLPEGLGEFYVAYRFFGTEGQTTSANDSGTTVARSRLDLNLIDLDYATREFSLGPKWTMRWNVGVRMANTYFDARDDTVIPAALGGGISEQHGSAHTIGAGPLVGLDLARQLPIHGLALYGRLEGAYLWVHESQNFDDFIVVPGTPLIGAAIHDPTTDALGVITVQGGLRWLPPAGWVLNSLFFGYEFEWWGQVGRDDNTGSLGDFFENGIFFRAEFTF